MTNADAEPLSAPELRATRRAMAADPAQLSADYSRFVRLIKVLLPSTAAGLILIVVLFSVLHRTASDVTLAIGDLTKLGGQLEMHNPTLTYTDEEKRAYYVNADHAVQAPGGNDRWHLDKIRGRMRPPEGRGYRLTSDTGLLDSGQKLLDLTGSVLVVSDEGYTFQARSAHVDMADNRVTSEEPVRAHGGVTSIESDRFEMWDKGNKIRFEGRVHYVSESAPRAAQQPAAQQPPVAAQAAKP